MKLGPTQGPRVVSRFIYEVEIMPYSFYNWPTQAMFFFLWYDDNNHDLWFAGRLALKGSCLIPLPYSKTQDLKRMGWTQSYPHRSVYSAILTILG